MTGEEDGLALLRSERPAERLRGARVLAASGQPSMLTAVRELRSRETDSWVRSALDRLIGKWQRQGAAIEEGQIWISVPADSALEDVRAEAIQSVTRVLVHEIRSLLRSITEAAMVDVGPGYGESETGRTIKRLREFLATVHQLHDAAASPRAREFDLADAIGAVIADCGYGSDQVLATRADPLITAGDADLLRLALANIVRNAVEASEETLAKVVVTCGATDTEAWVVVLDDGVGLPSGFEGAFKPGETSKSKAEHFGWGLTIAQRAVDSIGGELRLSPREAGGTACEIRWPLERTEVDQ